MNPHKLHEIRINNFPFKKLLFSFEWWFFQNFLAAFLSLQHIFFDHIYVHTQTHYIYIPNFFSPALLTLPKYLPFPFLSAHTAVNLPPQSEDLFVSQEAAHSGSCSWSWSWRVFVLFPPCYFPPFFQLWPQIEKMVANFVGYWVLVRGLLPAGYSKPSAIFSPSPTLSGLWVV